ncbi:type II secretion system F family protein [Ferrimicrobium acidiphilum]|uniref:type II secretion system F family protein n=1 Tax=Ferrimicrobium acidiphilum TaxID=121039 RepID=UPI0023F2FA08|nr:hypothetical protein [Ferrimicrobium acidiphilum]
MSLSTLLPSSIYTATVALIGAIVGLGALLVLRTFIKDAKGKPKGAKANSATSTGPRQLILSASAMLIVLLFTKLITFAVGAGVVTYVIMPLFSDKRQKHRIALISALASWIEQIRDSLRSSQGLYEVIKSSAEIAPPLMRPALMQMIRTVDQDPLRVKEALLQMAKGFNDETVDMVVGGLVVAVDLGGDSPIVEILSTLAHSARQEIDANRRIKAIQDRSRAEAKQVVFIVAAIFVFMFSIGKQFLTPYSTPPGYIAAVVVVALFVFGVNRFNRLTAPDLPPSIIDPELQSRAQAAAQVGRSSAR